MYMKDPIGSPDGSRISPLSMIAVTFMVVLTLQIGVMPAKVVHAAKRAVSSL